ncbi:MAG TPA: protein kinase [Planctomycetaceae bacterium]|jgi:serine/threonine protein kinase|nr:protein kinase [Planctomycetaceae bacterium]
MTEKRQCSKCGADLSLDAVQTVCPKCLPPAALESQVAAADRMATDPVVTPSLAEAATIPPSPSRRTPYLETLAGKLPHLDDFEHLGQGGMGIVYKARQRQLNRPVAVKILPPASGERAAFAERFTREAQALARLNHPNIVQVYDFGQTDDLFFFVMEYVDGVNLRALMRDGKLTPEEALKIVPQICEALQFAHDEGIVHRDIKPENLLIDKKGRLKIADFGLAKLLGQATEDFSLTGTGQLMGTLGYMAPEQLQQAHTVDHRADIYSLGVVFYEMLTSHLPIGRFELPSQKVHVDVRLDQVVLRALENEPDRRYQHASDVKTDVELASRPQAVPTPTAGEPESAIGALATSQPPATRSPMSDHVIREASRALWSERNKFFVNVVKALLLATYILGGLMFFTATVRKSSRGLVSRIGVPSPWFVLNAWDWPATPGQNTAHRTYRSLAGVDIRASSAWLVAAAALLAYYVYWRIKQVETGDQKKFRLPARHALAWSIFGVFVLLASFSVLVFSFGV